MGRYLLVSDVPTGLWLALGLVLGSLLVRGWMRGETSKLQKKIDSGTVDTPRSGVQIYCRGCGKELQSVRSQKGFDGTTGDPIYSFSRRCPDWTLPRAGTPGWLLGERLELVNCGTRSYSQLVRGHNHADELVVNTSCPTCVDIMLTDGVIDQNQAAKLYAKAGVS
jgi:hypothetical protein